MTPDQITTAYGLMACRTALLEMRECAETANPAAAKLVYMHEIDEFGDGTHAAWAHVPNDIMAQLTWVALQKIEARLRELGVELA